MVSERGIKNVMLKPPLLNSHPIASPSKRSAPMPSLGSNRLSRSSRMETPSELRKLGKDIKVRLLAAEEVMKLKPGVVTTRKEIKYSPHSPSNWKKEFSTSYNRNPMSSKNKFRKSSSSIPASRFAPKSLPEVATKPQVPQTRDALGNVSYLTAPSKRTSSERVEDRPGKRAVLPWKESIEKTLAKEIIIPSKQTKDADQPCSKEVSMPDKPGAALVSSPSLDKKIVETKHSGKAISDAFVPCQAVQALRSKSEKLPSGSDKDKLSDSPANPSPLEKKNNLYKHPGSITPHQEILTLSRLTKNPASNSKVTSDSKSLLLLQKKLPRCEGAIILADPCPTQTKAQENNLNRNKSVVQLQSGPLVDRIWMGSFEISSFPSDRRNYEGLTAHVSAIVSRKAYLLSQQMKAALEFTMLPQSDIMPKPFQVETPGKNDIALYFYGGKNERSRKQYSNLLKFLVQKKMMLQCSMGSANLLIFPSTVLKADAQKIGKSYFMWGAFQATKTKVAPGGAAPSLPAGA